ncbi:unnamed protein product [Porites lobata]|uniref:Cysteine-rich PDZ-binding protein n=1 Tax=Porites lobata TaxID=104759 RepID=A0ABN8PDC9_9CNID|nr:unnamed protein product [Porites lobata]
MLVVIYSLESGGRKVNENKLLTQKKNRFNPYTTFNKCRICKQTVHQVHSHYCQSCAYKKGLYLCHVRQTSLRYNQLQTNFSMKTNSAVMYLEFFSDCLLISA